MKPGSGKKGRSPEYIARRKAKKARRRRRWRKRFKKWARAVGKVAGVVSDAKKIKDAFKSDKKD